VPLPPRDDQTNLVKEHNAVIYAPGKSRDRFPENCVTIHESAESALQAADTEKNLFAAKVVGPSRSSEGFMLFYLVRWLSE
jgi:hypothetical protein